MKPRGRAAVVWLGVAALCGVAWSVLFALLPVSASAREAVEEGLRRSAARRLESDARTLRAVVRGLDASPEFAAIVDGGGAAVRPGRLFTLLSRALPPGKGWGAAVVDASGRAVAWAGEPAGAMPPPRREPALFVSFRVTGFSMIHSAPRKSAEPQSVVMVSRRYPTGVVAPDLLGFDSSFGTANRSRVFVKASSRADRLVSLGIDAEPAVLDDDARRARARPGALLGALSLLALGVAAGSTAPALVAARLVLVLGAPRSGSGIWELLSSAPTTGLGSLVETPADLFLTGLTLLFLARCALLASWRGPTTGRRRSAWGALAIVLAAIPFLGGRGAGVRGFDAGSTGLFPTDVSNTLLRVGAAALFGGLVALAAWSARRAGVRGSRFAAPLGLAFVLAALFRAGESDAGLFVLAASLALVASLAERAGAFESSGLFVRTTSAVLFAAV
ncbi:MAG TPA: hypothetical protein VGR00_01320, partial [Thermoanaerobaculia bacterium]|nr:hypothetical protein [Thermoanaerobaculia bacterium]